LALRYDYLNLNSKDIFGVSGENYTLGLTFHANDNVKMMLNYQHSRNDKHAGNNGAAAIGRDANGNYTTAISGPTAAVSDYGIRFNVIQARVEINF
jgi:phosphate-selective porin OprO/OprP